MGAAGAGSRMWCQGGLWQCWSSALGPCLASPGVILMCERVRSSCPSAQSCWRGLSQCSPSWVIPNSQDPQGWSSQTSPVTSAETVPAPISITQSISQVTPLLLSSVFNLVQGISVDQEHLVQNTEAAAHPLGSGPQ